MDETVGVAVVTVVVLVVVVVMFVVVVVAMRMVVEHGDLRHQQVPVAWLELVRMFA